MAELLPCPFCGSEKLKIDSKRTFNYGNKRCAVAVRCNSCHARGPVAGILMPDGQYNERELVGDKAADLWNTRTTAESEVSE